jgi:antitoxin MazE
MATTVQKWGNSLGIRVPKVVAEQVNLQLGSQIEFDTANGVLTVRPVRTRRRSKYKLSELLAGFKGPSPYRHLDLDRPVGKEIL